MKRCMGLLLFFAMEVGADSASKDCVDLEALGGEARMALLEQTVYPRIQALYTDYPKAALEACIEGRVLLELIVGTDGRVEEVSIVEGTGQPLLDKGALTQAHKVATSIDKKPLVRAGHCLSEELVLRVPVDYSVASYLHCNMNASGTITRGYNEELLEQESRLLPEYPGVGSPSAGL